MRVAQHVAGNLFDEIGMRRDLIEEGHVSGEFRPNGLETPDLKLQQRGAIDQLGASLEAVPAMYRMVGEIGCETQAGKQNGNLRQPRPPNWDRATRHLFELTNTQKRRWSGNAPEIDPLFLRGGECE